ncbi:MAG: 16S rRNA (cytosine(1402)-N(4))-methyltransferase RsmH [Chitinophagales bacterium]|jgi:16S rRNA (cytosine1402-N4)-methyltransferase|nr:16S rRNA (cytosine(1402)-N(4))-methyltransferase RsmH [Chitinophagales bacterium]
MYHVPVLLSECIEALQIKPDGVYVDVTFGGGGHSRLILEKLGPNGSLIAFDQDADAAKNVPADDRIIFVAANYRHLFRFLRLHDALPVDGILADFGISSHQIDAAERGFAIRFDAPLDMRMDQSQAVSAKTVVNTYNAEDLQTLFSRYGEITNSKTLAQTIVEARKLKAIETTFELRDIAKRVAKGNEMSYLAQVFQAIRIETNDEINGIKEFLEQSKEALVEGGRLVTLSYHSLEDRLVKDYTRYGNFNGEHQKDDFGNIYRPFNLITKKPLEASAEEIKQNSRARSAKMRIAEKI